MRSPRSRDLRGTNEIRGCDLEYSLMDRLVSLVTLGGSDLARPKAFVRNVVWTAAPRAGRLRRLLPGRLLSPRVGPVTSSRRTFLCAETGAGASSRSPTTRARP